MSLVLGLALACGASPSTSSTSPATCPEVTPRAVDAPPTEGKLAAEDIRDGILQVKAGAECQCKRLAQGGEKVVVVLKIDGATGTVISADTAEDPLSGCAAEFLRQARFRRFTAPEQGAQVSIRF